MHQKLETLHLSFVRCSEIINFNYNNSDDIKLISLQIITVKNVTPIAIIAIFDALIITIVFVHNHL